MIRFPSISSVLTLTNGMTSGANASFREFTICICESHHFFSNIWNVFLFKFDILIFKIKHELHLPSTFSFFLSYYKRESKKPSRVRKNESIRFLSDLPVHLYAFPTSVFKIPSEWNSRSTYLPLLISTHRLNSSNTSSVRRKVYSFSMDAPITYSQA